MVQEAKFTVGHRIRATFEAPRQRVGFAMLRERGPIGPDHSIIISRGNSDGSDSLRPSDPTSRVSPRGGDCG